MEEAKEYFKEQWGDNYFGGQLMNTKRPSLEFSANDIYELMQSYAEQYYQKQLLIQMMKDDEKDGIYNTKQ